MSTKTSTKRSPAASWIARDPVPVGPVRADHRHQRDEPGVGQQPGDLADAAHVLGPVGGREPEVGVEPVTQVVAVEHVGGTSVVEQARGDGVGDGRLARSGQPGEPHGRAGEPVALASASPGRPRTRARRPVRSSRAAQPLAGAQHPRRHGLVGRLVDQDEAPRGAVAAVVVGEQRGGGAERDPTDLVELRARSPSVSRWSMCTSRR